MNSALVSLDVLIVSPSIDNASGLCSVKLASYYTEYDNPTTDCIIEDI